MTMRLIIELTSAEVRQAIVEYARQQLPTDRDVTWKGSYQEVDREDGPRSAKVEFERLTHSSPVDR